MQPNMTHQIATARIADLQRVAAERSVIRDVRHERSHSFGLAAFRRYIGRARGGHRTLLRWSA